MDEGCDDVVVGVEKRWRTVGRRQATSVVTCHLGKEKRETDSTKKKRPYKEIERKRDVRVNRERPLLTKRNTKKS